MVGKNFVSIGDETTFGTFASTLRTYPVKSDGAKTAVLTMGPDGILPGQQGPSAVGARSTVLGGTAPIETYLASKGMGLLLRGVFGDAVVTTPEDATDTRQHVYTSGPAGSTRSFSRQTGREKKDGTVDPDSMVGGQISEFRLGQDLAPVNGGVGDTGLATVGFDFDFAGLARETAALTSWTVPSPEAYFGVGECTLSIGADLESLAAECLNKFGFKFPTGLDFEDRCIRPGLTRDKATRGSLPAPTLDLGWTYKNRTYYDAFLDGTVMAFRAKWDLTPSGIEIEEGFSPSVTLDLPAIQFTGDTPEMSKDSRTTQALPARVLWNGTDPMVTLTLITSDTTY